MAHHGLLVARQAPLRLLLDLLAFPAHEHMFAYRRRRASLTARMRPIEETTVLITGATDGLGRGVARDLAARGAQRAAPRPQPGEARRAERGARRRADVPGRPRLARRGAQARRGGRGSSTDALHVLINNAGIGGGAPDGTTRQESKDGHELRLAVNHLAGFLLTLRLLPLLRRSKPARVVFVASLGQAPMDFDDPMLERGYSGSRAYGQSKLAQITTGFELANRLDPNEVTVTSLHPSTYMPTKMVLEARGSSVDTLEAGIEATVAPRRRPRARGRDRALLRPPAREHARPAGERSGAAQAPVGAVARARRRARAGALDRHRRREGRAEAVEQRDVAEQLDVVERPAVPQRGRKRAGIGEDREVRIVGGAPPRLEAPAPDLQREPIVTQPEVDAPPRTRRAGTASSRRSRTRRGPAPPRRPGTAPGSPTPRARRPAARAPAPTR